MCVVCCTFWCMYCVLLHVLVRGCCDVRFRGLLSESRISQITRMDAVLSMCLPNPFEKTSFNPHVGRSEQSDLRHRSTLLLCSLVGRSEGSEVRHRSTLLLCPTNFPVCANAPSASIRVLRDSDEICVGFRSSTRRTKIFCRSDLLVAIQNATSRPGGCSYRREYIDIKPLFHPRSSVLSASSAIQTIRRTKRCRTSLRSLRPTRLICV